MLSGIFDMLSTLFDLFLSLVRFAFQLVQGLVEFVEGLLNAPAVITDIVASGIIPPVLSYGILATITTVIILRVAGRD